MKPRMIVAALGALLALWSAGPALAQSTNGVKMPAFYDCKVFNINFKFLSPDAAQKILNGPAMQFNTIYMFADACGSANGGVTMVLDAIQGTEKEPVPRNGFNPLWQVVLVTGGCPSTSPDVLCSDNLILAPGSGVTLSPQPILARCSVVGPGK